jgi:hypothetical protein
LLDVLRTECGLDRQIFSADRVPRLRGVCDSCRSQFVSEYGNPDCRHQSPRASHASAAVELYLRMTISLLANYTGT